MRRLAVAPSVLPRGEVDVAIVRGPVAGFVARRLGTPLRLTPVEPQIDLPFLRFVYDMAMGVRHGHTLLRARLDGALERRAVDEGILERFGVPRVAPSGMTAR